MTMAIPMPQEKIFNASAVNLNYLDHGSSSTEPLVMLHGGAWRWQEYLSLIPSIGRRWHIYERAGGHSIGGVIALMVAARCPDKVKALIIEDSPLTLDNYRRIIDSSRDMFGLWLDLKESAQSEQKLSLALAHAYTDYPGVTSAWILFFAGCLWRLDPTFFDALLHDFEGFAEEYDYRQILATIDCPMLFLRGEMRLGAVMTDEEVSWLQRNVRHVKCVLIDRVGHLLHLQDQGQMPVLTEMLAVLGRL
jgi:pimeloyl-ACP methyl ester carboxylesterase